MSEYRPAPEAEVGRTRVGELLFVDIRTAMRIPEGTALWDACNRLSHLDPAAAGAVEGTFVIDLLEATEAERVVLLDPTAWPKPAEVAG